MVLNREGDGTRNGHHVEGIRCYSRQLNMLFINLSLISFPIKGKLLFKIFNCFFPHQCLILCLILFIIILFFFFWNQKRHVKFIFLNNFVT
ncbi:hypothetical protein HanPI659440_Chr04g0169011 [Helianthus annuus]|nr:hypothetical protein HanPI659440_Chr04g0169011 [Helianthus annuus]